MAISTFFFGTPEFCLPVLQMMHQAGRGPRGIVCQPDRPAGRGCQLCAPATKDWAAQACVEVLQPERCKDLAFLDAVRAMRPDLGVVFAFGQILPKALLEIPPLGFINIHPSLIPLWRGAAPVQWTLIHGDRRTGVSILRVTPRLDDGEVLLQEATKIESEENTVELMQRLAPLGGKLLLQALELLERGPLAGTPQDEAAVTWAPTLAKQDGVLDWTQPALALHNRVRGVQPWPGAATAFGGKLLKIHRASIGPAWPQGRAGEVVRATPEELLVRTGEGTLRLLEVQLEGKRRVDARAFLAGRALRVGDVLGG